MSSESVSIESIFESKVISPRLVSLQAFKNEDIVKNATLTESE